VPHDTIDAGERPANVHSTVSSRDVLCTSLIKMAFTDGRPEMPAGALDFRVSVSVGPVRVGHTSTAHLPVIRSVKSSERDEDNLISVFSYSRLDRQRVGNIWCQKFNKELTAIVAGSVTANFSATAVSSVPGGS
jgi:hypothetical protein